MTLDPRFIIASDLQSLFRDPATGLPLSDGTAKFYQDINRINLKPIYQITGNPPDYTYTELPNPCPFTAGGTLSDGNTPANDIIAYYFPYLGTPDENDNTVDLYYVVVADSGGNEKFVRPAWPNFIAGGGLGENEENFIPNGQFLIHNNIQANPTGTTPNNVPGQITLPITEIAPGGWTFERPSGSTATDIVTFPAYSGYVAAPTASPRFSLHVQNTVVSSGDNYKNICVKFYDVNKFASDTQPYNYYFEAESDGSPFPVNISVIKNFGQGGSATITEEISTLTIPSSFGQFNVPITFGDNSGQTIGAGSYVQIAIKLPVAAIFSAHFDNFALTFGTTTLAAFPTQTDPDMIVRSTYAFLPVPDPNGFDLFLKPVFTQTGMAFDTSEIGNVVFESCVNTYDSNGFNASTNRLLPNGKSYITSTYSPLNIPMARLFNQYYSSTLNLPLYGTGANYVTAINASTSLGALNTELLITTNTPGSVTNTVDGATATGFTIATIHTGNNYGTVSYIVPTGGFGTGQFYIQNTAVGAVTAPSLGSASAYMTFALGTVGTGKISGVVQLGNALVAEIVGFQPPSTGAAGMTAGQYIQFSTPSTNYYIWWKIGSSGTDPAPGGTGIEVDLEAADTQTSVGEKIRQALNGWQQTTLQVVAGSSITAGAYFRVFSTTVTYSIWYSVGGVGSAPNVSDQEIQVAILSADTIQEVITKTVIAMNSFQFAVPDYRGLFLRNINNGGTGDPDAVFRYSLVPLVLGDNIGTSQNNQNQSHTHYENSFNEYQGSSSTEGFIQNGSSAIVIAGYPEGGRQSNPNNASTNMAIIY